MLNKMFVIRIAIYFTGLAAVMLGVYSLILLSGQEIASYHSLLPGALIYSTLEVIKLTYRAEN